MSERRSDYWEGREDGERIGRIQGMLTGGALMLIVVLLVAQCWKAVGA